MKELSQLAQISKATFYLHYRDIFDLSEQLQQEAIQKVLSYGTSPLDILDNLPKFSRDMDYALETEAAAVSALFSGSQAAALPISLKVQLSYHIQGGYYAYMENVSLLGRTRVLELIDKIYAVSPIVINGRSARKSNSMNSSVTTKEETYVPK